MLISCQSVQLKYVSLFRIFNSYCIIAKIKIISHLYTYLLKSNSVPLERDHRLFKRPTGSELYPGCTKYACFILALSFVNKVAKREQTCSLAFTLRGQQICNIFSFCVLVLGRVWSSPAGRAGTSQPSFLRGCHTWSSC